MPAVLLLLPAREVVPGPAEAVWLLLLPLLLLLLLAIAIGAGVVGVRKGVGGLGAPGAAEELPLRVVVAPPRRVRQRVVGIVDELESARPLRTLGRVGRDPVRVGFQGGAV